MRTLVGMVMVVALAGCGNRQEGSSTSKTAEDGPKPATRSAMRCTLRVSTRGLYVDGDPKSQAEAVEICKHRAGAMVVLEDGVAMGSRS